METKQWKDVLHVISGKNQYGRSERTGRGKTEEGVKRCRRKIITLLLMRFYVFKG